MLSTWKKFFIALAKSHQADKPEVKLCQNCLIFTQFSRSCCPVSIDTRWLERLIFATGHSTVFGSDHVGSRSALATIATRSAISDICTRRWHKLQQSDNQAIEPGTDFINRHITLRSGILLTSFLPKNLMMSGASVYGHCKRASMSEA